MKYLIVGIDPGTKVGIAILNLNGKLIHVESGKKIGLNKIVDIISNFGRPVLISTDVSHEPSLVHKVASYFNSKIILPSKDLSIKYKRDITKDYAFEDDHQRDALAAALTAYMQYEQLFIKIKKVLTSMGLQDKIDLVKKKLILGEANTIKDALKEKKSKEEYIEIKAQAKKSRTLLECEKKVKELEKANEFLKSEKIKLESEINKLKDNLERHIAKKYEQRMRNKDYTIRSLEEVILEKDIQIVKKNKEIDKLNKKIELIMKGYLPIIEVESPKDILRLNENYFGHGVIIKNSYTKLSKNVSKKIEELHLRLIHNGKTFSIDGILFLESEEGDVVEEIQNIIDKWRRRSL